MKKQKLRLVQLSTTQFEENDILLVTDLSDEEIESVVYPIVDSLTESYTNESIAQAIIDRYPKRVAIPYNTHDVEYLSI